MNKNNLCDIYTELGEENLCYTCKTYPRVIEEYSNLREIGISMSCPEAARLILQDSKPITFEVLADDEIENTYDDINFDISVQLISAKKMTLDILQNRSIDLNHRIALLINFAHDIQEKINEHELSKISDTINQYFQKNYQKELINEFNKYKTQPSVKYDNILKCMNMYKNLNPINNN